MTNTSFLDVGIDEQEEVTVKDITTKDISMKDNTEKQKCVLACETDDGRTISMSDVYVNDKSGSPKIQGLWWNGKITPGSAMYKVLRYYSKSTLRELIGAKVKVVPDPNDFLILAACDMPSGPSQKANLFD